LRDIWFLAPKTLDLEVLFMQVLLLLSAPRSVQKLSSNAFLQRYQQFICHYPVICCRKALIWSFVIGKRTFSLRRNLIIHHFLVSHINNGLKIFHIFLIVLDENFQASSSPFLYLFHNRTASKPEIPSVSSLLLIPSEHSIFLRPPLYPIFFKGYIRSMCR